MDEVRLTRSRGLRGEITVPSDKSVSHRSVMFASLAEGKSRIRNFLSAQDPLSTVHAVRMLGVDIAEETGNAFTVEGKGLHGLAEPTDVIDCANSGTTMRLLSGILSGNPFLSILTGDESLRQRPMARIINPLREMGAHISARSEGRYPPMAINGGALRAIDYRMPVASAQVKSCLLLAGLYAGGVTSVAEPTKSRDHTERMLRSMGAPIEIEGLTVRMSGGAKLNAFDIMIPSDFSSAAFFLCAALIVPHSDCLIRDVGLNPTRTGLLDIMRAMGAEVEIENPREISGEPIADIHCVTADRLVGVKIGAETVSLIIDEFPVLCVLAAQAEGVTEIRGAEELRVKESDRIRTMAVELGKMGVDLEEFSDGIAIKGGRALRGAEIESHGDHRIAMALSVASLVAEGTTTIHNASCVDVSFPGFYQKLQEVSVG